MFDQQLTFDGRSEDIAPATSQDRLFTAPKTIKGQMPMSTDACQRCGLYVPCERHTAD